ncbi:MAG: hypothetical protein IKA63_05360 [Clostridia bacterium]|nr:hypothetical protein [Clostridia bacterium]
MKIKYLSTDDKHRLHLLRHAEDPDRMAELLEEALLHSYTLQSLWVYRKWFLALTDEQLRDRPTLVCGVVLTLVMQGNFDQARELAETLPKEGLHYPFLQLMMPDVSREELLETVRTIKEKGWKSRANIILTAGRPSVLNGFWDLTPYGGKLSERQDTALELLESLFGEQAHSIYEVMNAEVTYWRDDCYTALVQVVGIIPFLRERQDMRLLFAALTLEMYIMVLNGQATVTAPLINNLRQQLKHNHLEEYLPNIDALDAWSAMYDGDYVRVAHWLREGAPDEYGKFCMLDVFRYMVKMRAYIIGGKYLAVTALAARLMPLLEIGRRYMDMCELHLLWGISDHAAGREADALEHIGEAVRLSETYGYDRLFADEGKRAHDLLLLYRKQQGKTPYLDRVIALADKTAALHPRYLKDQLPEKPALTEAEMRILRLLADCKTNGEIAEEVNIAVDTAKQHCKHIFAKLEVKNRQQAVRRAVEFGLLEPV